MTEQLPTKELFTVRYFVCRATESVAVGDSFGPPDDDGWDEIGREEFDRLHQGGYYLDGDDQ